MREFSAKIRGFPHPDPLPEGEGVVVKWIELTKIPKRAGR
jgi:hypothetical protein